MINKIDLLTDEEFKNLIENSASTADVLRALDYSVLGNSWAYKIIAERMDKLQITFGKKLKYDNNNYTLIPLKKILEKDSNYNRTKLKERLVREGIKEYKCECCGIAEWNSKPISLQLHHKNGINNDNRLSNLQLLCPNCHSQTENFGTKGTGRVIKNKAAALPLKDKETIINTVAELGIVEARKVLPYRNSLINSIIRNLTYKVVMITPTNETVEFNTAADASRYMFNKLGIGINPDSNRTSIVRCYIGKQDSIKGYKFIKRSIEE